MKTSEALEEFKLSVNKLFHITNNIGINDSFDRTRARKCIDELTIAFNTYIESLTNNQKKYAND